MTQRFVQRYFSALNHYRWLGLASFAACVGVSGAIALRLGLPPTYKAEAVLVYNNNTPSTFVSDTAAKIQEQSKPLTREELLSDPVIKEAAQRTNVAPQQVAKNVKIQLSQDKSQIIKVAYLDTDQKRAVDTLTVLMRGMLRQSFSLKQEPVRALIKSIDYQLPSQIARLQAVERYLNQDNRREAIVRADIEQELKRRREQLSKLRAAREDALIAAADRMVPIEVIQPPQVVADTESNQSVLQTLGMGAVAGLGVSAGLIPLLGLMAQKPGQSEVRRKLMAAYNGRCAISGCDIPQALEAVQINPQGDRSNRLSNWLLLRADLKKLFDTHQLVIEPTTMTVLIDPSLADTKYAELAGRPVYLPDDEASRPSIKALKSHFSQHGWTNHINFG